MRRTDDLRRRRRRFTPLEDVALMQMRIAGESVYTIAKRLDPPRSRSSVQSRLEILARQTDDEITDGSW